MRRIDRRDFAKEAGLAFLSGVTVTISSACGGGGGGYSSGSPTSGSPTTTTPPAVTDKVGAISDNHGHVAVITAARLEAGGGYSLDIAGTSGHSQMITLTTDALAQIKAGRAVDTVSSNVDGHVHVVTFNGGGGDPPTRY
jgi:hypothetical protein